MRTSDTPVGTIELAIPRVRPGTYLPRWRADRRRLREGSLVQREIRVEIDLGLVGAILLEQDDESAFAERRYLSAESMKQLTAPTLPATAGDLRRDCVKVRTGVGTRGKPTLWFSK